MFVVCTAVGPYMIDDLLLQKCWVARQKMWAICIKRVSVARKLPIAKE
jgi:hypothetical protein